VYGESKNTNQYTMILLSLLTYFIKIFMLIKKNDEMMKEFLRGKWRIVEFHKARLKGEHEKLEITFFKLINHL
jgi:hypothetical protein